MLGIHLRVLAAALSLCVATLAAPQAPRVVHESRRSLPTGWTPVRRAAPDLVLPLRVGLAQPNLESLEDYLLDVAHPASPNYGRHWTPAKVARTFAPAPASVAAVRAWLAEGGVGGARVRRSGSGGWLLANVSVAEAERLLGTEYYVYAHADADREHVACHGAYRLPAHVAKHVDLVTPTLHFDVPLRRDGARAQLRGASAPVAMGPAKGLANDLSTCDQQITPDCLRALYNFHGFTSQAAHKNSLAIGKSVLLKFAPNSWHLVVEYGPETYTADDLDLFFKNFSASQIGERPKLISIDGGESPASLEATTASSCQS